MRRFVFLMIFLVIVSAIAATSGVVGYLTHREEFQPIYGLGERAIIKGRRVLGMPTETVGAVANIETTFLNLRGTAYLMPDYDWRNGGALALWGEDILVLHRSGKIFYLDEETGLIRTGLQVPENGLAGYIALAASKYPQQMTRADAVRYNDLEYIDSPAFHGLLLSYTYIDNEKECYANRVAKLELPRSGTDASARSVSASGSDWDVLYESKPCLEFNPSRELIVAYMSGGRMAFKAPNLLYLGNGEYHREGFYRPDAGIQSPDSDYGKTIEINLETGDYRHFSIGHRNLQGVTIDKEGRLWTTEHGMRGGDELNLVKDGENYGWPLENLGTLYSKVPAPTAGEPGRHILYEPPVYAWVPSAAVSSVAVVDGFHPTWDGDLLVGSLKGRTLFRVRVQDERLIFLEPIPIGQRIRDVMQVRPDTIALWLDTGELVLLVAAPIEDPMENMIAGLQADGVSSEQAELAHDILNGCRECHALEASVHGAGPSLHGILGRTVASTAFANYSDALGSFGGAWTEERLKAYLIAPEDVVDGTSMTGLGVGDAGAADALLSAFKWLAAQE